MTDEILRCDFCEEEDETASFDPDWDAVVCDRCEAELDNDMYDLKQKRLSAT